VKPAGDHELSEQELEELKALFEGGFDNSDRWYLLKFHLALLAAAYYAFAMSFFPGMIIDWLDLQSSARAGEWEFIFRMRGMFISFAALVAVYSYLHDMHMRLIFGSTSIIAFVNLVMDFPVFYWEKFASPSLAFGMILTLIIIIVVLLFSLYANIDRISDGPRRLFANPFRIRRKD